MTQRLRHDLFEELDAFDSNWQHKFTTIADAAQAADVMHLYSDWLLSEHGQHYLRKIRSARNHAAENEIRRAQRQAEVAMAARGRTQEARGYLTDGDEV